MMISEKGRSDKRKNGQWTRAVIDSMVLKPSGSRRMSENTIWPPLP